LAFENVCVIGAGISGLTVANELAQAGLKVSLVEKNPYPGGQAAFYGCKATDSCRHCAVCLLRDSISAFKRNPQINSYFSAQPQALTSNGNGEFELEVETKANPIDWKICNECGLCAEICPEGMVIQIPGWKFIISQECTACGKCVQACPAGAIQLDRETERDRISASSLVVATGFKPFNPRINRKWGYGTTPHIITGSDLEQLFFEEKYLPIEVKKMAFVQCVGSRNTVEGESHCSRVCCAYALRMANRLKQESPELQIDFFYMDIQYFGKHFEQLWQEVYGELDFIQSNPISVATDQEGRPIVRYESLPERRCKESVYDLVVLSNGISPGTGSEKLADLFNIDLDPRGFLHPVESKATAPRGIFTAGTCRKPMRIDECVEDASNVSNKVLNYMGVEI
jgi:heterodisulfide reductase subunit A